MIDIATIHFIYNRTICSHSSHISTNSNSNSDLIISRTKKQDCSAASVHRYSSLRHLPKGQVFHKHLNRRGQMFPVFHGKPKLTHAVPCVPPLLGRDHSAGQQRIFAERDIKLPHSPPYHRAVLPDRTWKTFLFQRKCGERHSPFPARLKTQFAAETEVMWGLTPSYQ